MINLEIIPFIDTINSCEIEKLKKMITELLNYVYIPSSVLYIYIVNSHDNTRNTLGIEKLLNFEEKEVKLFIEKETENPVLSIKKSLLQNLDKYRIEILKELITYEVITLPDYVSIWSIPDYLISNKYAKFLSVAIMYRLIDKLLIERGFENYLRNEFENKNTQLIKEVLKNRINNEKLLAIQLLTYDTPFSFELCGYSTIGKELYLNYIVKELLHFELSNFKDKYDDFRDFLRNNFNLESGINYLEMIFS